MLLLRRRVALAVLTAALSAIALFHATRIDADFTIQELFHHDDPEITYLDKVRRWYGADDDLVALLIESTDVFSRETLSLVARLTKQLRALDSTRRVDSLTTVSDLGADGAGALDTRPIFFHLPRDASETATLKRRALSSPLLARRFVAKDGTLTAIAIRLAKGISRAKDVERAIKAIETIVAGAKPPSKTVLRLAGVPYVRTEAVRSIQADQRRFLPLTSILTLLILLYLYRSLHGVLIPLAAIGLSTGYTIGLMSLLGQPLDILSNVLPVLVMVYGVADAVHMLGRMHEQMRAGDGRDVAIRTTVRQLGLACLLTSATTAIGFGSLLSSSMSILQRFGVFAAAGVLIAYVLTMVIVPLGVALFRVDPTRVAQVTQNRALNGAFDRLASLTTRRPRLLVASALLIGGGALLLGLNVRVDNFLLGIYRHDHPTSVVTRLAEEKLQGVVSLQVSFEGDPNALKRPETLRAIERVEHWVRRQPGVLNTISLALYVKALHRAIAGTSQIPGDAKAIAQLLLMTEGAEGIGIDRLVNSDYRRGRILVSLRDIGARRYLDLADRLRAALPALLGDAPLSGRVTGTSMVAYRGINRLVYNLMFSLSIAFFLIAAVLALAFRSLKVGLISLIPNVLPLTGGLGFMVLTGMRLEPTTVMIYSIAFGIAVDDTIHFIARYREESEAGADAAQAIHRTLRTTGRAMVITSAVLIVGFGVVLVSNFPNTQRFGMLGCVILTFALLTDLIVTPACMMIFKPWQRQRGEAGREV